MLAAILPGLICRENQPWSAVPPKRRNAFCLRLLRRSGCRRRRPAHAQRFQFLPLPRCRLGWCRLRRRLLDRNRWIPLFRPQRLLLRQNPRPCRRVREFCLLRRAFFRRAELSPRSQAHRKVTPAPHLRRAHAKKPPESPSCPNRRRRQRLPPLKWPAPSRS